MILIKGAGDLATGVAYKLKKYGFNIAMTEIAYPTTVRRTLAFSQAVYFGPLYGAVVGAVSNIITGIIFNPKDIPFFLVNVAAGAIVGYIAKKLLVQVMRNLESH